MYAWKAALPRWPDFEKAIYTGANSSGIVVSANIDSYLLRNENFGSQAFFSSVKESIHYSVCKMTSGRIMKNGALDVERSKYCNTNRCLQFSAEAGFSLIDSVISRILSPCEVPHEDMYFLFTWFEIIPTVMYLWCFSSAEKHFLTNALCVGVPWSKWNSSLLLAPKAVFILLHRLVQPWGCLVTMWSAHCWVIPLAPLSVRAIKGKPVASG